ncbi:tripartite tricarboxylate transporter TctB family protein [Quisquiliibacterium transsilvanicum]|uniref:Putative tricarboxylic transport membrane protein n=1 Tax=Quisquiliibacterium transsilvanicum TaxID=1549638 RepID=A0A7W8M6Y1_9BURK|nr:tripartite tricarboxylate transporter TctB family protein [Quisquiliibacterium transsilvanicum]MBB5270371.1 putative tricarboxylic transport membrane protein [Quisquiliibacterium transsilvanicum]
MSKAGEHHHTDAVGSDSSLSVEHHPHAGRPWARGEVDLVAGVFLLVFAGLAWWFGQPLKIGTAFRMGPGFVPMLLTWALGAFGIGLIAMGLLHRGPALEGWRLKPMVLVLGAMALFGLTIESLGLLVASTLAVFVSGIAAPGFRLREVLLLASALAVGSVLLFPVALNLSLRIFP